MGIDNELDELFNDPLLDVTDKEITLFNLPADMKRVMERRRLQPDHYAQKKTCEDFHLYKPLFEQVQQELKEGKRNLVRTSKTSSLDEGHFYVVDGMLVLLQSIVEKRRSSNGLTDGRTRCIYENGTESDILLQTLRTNILKEGFGVTDLREQSDDYLQKNMNLEDDDRATGFVYVLRSLSPDPQIAGIKNLYKIGFTINSVEERISNAVDEPTYLNAPVRIVETFQVVNMNSHIFETLVHQALHQVQVQLKVYDGEGNLHVPTEWYVAPLEIIELIIQRITDGSITQYSYNATMQCLEKRITKSSSFFNTKGLKVLTLHVKEGDLKEFVDGSRTTEQREIKQTTINRFTYIDHVDGIRYLRRYDLIRFVVGHQKNANSALLEIKDTTFANGFVEYHLGRLLEYVKGEAL